MLDERNIITAITNSLIDILNRRERLPKYLVIVPDRGVIKTANFFDFGVVSIMKKIINKIQRNVSRLLTTRQEDLQDKKPGAVDPTPTRIIWVKMFDSPVFKTHPDEKIPKILALRRKFNKTLENRLAEYSTGFLHITEVSHLAIGEHFDNLGFLNQSGLAQFWKEIDCNIKKFDRGETQLTPIWTPEDDYINRPYKDTMHF